VLLILIDLVLCTLDWGSAGQLMAVVSLLAFEAVSLFMLLFRFRTCVLLRNAKEYSEVGEVNAVRDGRNGNHSVGS
jgi:hypothetical protein